MTCFDDVSYNPLDLQYNTSFPIYIDGSGGGQSIPINGVTGYPDKHVPCIMCRLAVDFGTTFLGGDTQVAGDLSVSDNLILYSDISAGGVYITGQELSYLKDVSSNLQAQITAKAQRGETGPTGPAGSAGPAGSGGPAGATGIQGIQGIQGSKGDTGATGTSTNGTTGAKGDTGSQGIQGIQGIQGVAGAKGDTGSQGVQGATGSSGAAQLSQNNTWTGSQTFSAPTNFTSKVTKNSKQIRPNQFYRTNTNIELMDSLLGAMTYVECIGDMSISPYTVQIDNPIYAQGVFILINNLSSRDVSLQGQLPLDTRKFTGLRVTDGNLAISPGVSMMLMCGSDSWVVIMENFQMDFQAQITALKSYDVPSSIRSYLLNISSDVQGQLNGRAYNNQAQTFSNGKQNFTDMRCEINARTGNCKLTTSPSYIFGNNNITAQELSLNPVYIFQGNNSGYVILPDPKTCQGQNVYVFVDSIQNFFVYNINDRLIFRGARGNGLTNYRMVNNETTHLISIYYSWLVLS